MSLVHCVAAILAAATLAFSTAQAQSANGTNATTGPAFYVRLKSGVAQDAKPWLLNLQANPNARAALGGPIVMRHYEPGPAIDSGLLPNDPMHPLRKLARTVRLEFPIIANPQALAQRLANHPDIEWKGQQLVRRFRPLAAVSDPYFNPATLPTGNWQGSSGTQLPRNPWVSAPNLSTPSGSQTQLNSIIQWGHQKIGAPAAWDLLGSNTTFNNPSQGFYGTANIAVVDWGLADGCLPFFNGNCSGASRYHPDLSPNVRNQLSIGLPFEAAAGSGQFFDTDLTNDALEFIDKDAVGTYSVMQPQGLESNPLRPPDRSNQPFAQRQYALTGHGTNAAGIIAAAINGQGVVGVCPTCSLAMYRTNTAPDALELMVRMAKQHGNQIISMSWQPQVPLTAESSQENEEAESPLNLLLASAGSQEVFLVAAAGNDGPSQPNGSSLSPFVTSAGASDLTDYPWSENRLEPSGRCTQAGATGCESFYPITVGANQLGDRFVFAPGARILSTMYGTWIGRNLLSGETGSFGRGACTHELFPADASPNATQFNSRYGICTGTSFAAPYVAAAGALIRSVSPLLPQAQVRQVLQSTGNAVTFPAGVTPYGTPKRIRADLAVQATLATIAGTPETNRLIPLLASRSSERRTTNSLNPIIVPHRDWLFSSKPQMIAASMLGELYHVQRNLLVGQRNVVPFDDQITNIPNVGGYSTISGTKGSARASSFLFATQRQAYPGAPDSLIPLYRLSMFGNCVARKHIYSTSLAPPSLSLSTLSSNGTACLAPGFNPLITQARFEQVAVEGFVFPTQQGGTVPLQLKYNAADGGSYALMIPSDASRPEFSGYGDPSQGNVVLGYVFENLSNDGDDWPDAWEIAVGLNNLVSDSDCDGLSDSAEFPMAGISTSNPMSSSNCADLRLRKTVSPLSYYMSNPIGPSAAQNPTLELTYSGSTIGGSFTLVAPTAPGWTCAPGSITYLPQNSFTATRICSGPSSLAVSPTEVVFSFPVGGSAPVGTTYLPISAQAKTTSTDPVPANNLTN